MEVIMEFIKYLVFVLALSVSADGAKAPAGAPASPAAAGAPIASLSPDIPVVNLDKRRLFVFGDGLLDTGNDVYYSGDERVMSLPYGMTFYTPTGRPGDGLIIPDYIATYANLSPVPPILKPGLDISDFSEGANFAVVGASITEAAAPADHPTIVLPKQIENFKKLAAAYSQQYGEANATTLMNKSVFLFSIGVMDCVYCFTAIPKATEAQMTEYVTGVLGNLTTALTDMFNAGARRFAFMNLGPLGCEPGMKELAKLGKDKCVESVNQICKIYNEALPKTLEAVKAKSQGFEYSVFDYYNTLLDRIMNPAKYGFKEGDVACCGTGPNRASSCGTDPYEMCPSPSFHVYFDGGYTTQSTNYQVADQMFWGEANVTTPSNIEKLFLLP